VRTAQKVIFSDLFRFIASFHGLYFLFCMAFVFSNSTEANATHLRAGQITVTRDAQCSRKVFVKIEVWTNTVGTNVLFGGDQDYVDWGDGSTPLKFPQIPNQVKTELNPDGSVAYAYIELTHTYNGIGTYIISYREPNRNEGVLNMDRSVETTFYLETQIKIDPSIGCNESPYLSIPPIDRACPGVAFTHNPGAYDPDDEDSLSYEMVVPFADRNTEVLNYRDPNSAQFYTNFNNGNEAQNGPPEFNIDSVTGTITWDAPGAVGEYNIAFHVVEWRNRDGIWRKIGYVRRDMQIIVEDCDNERPDLEIPRDTCIVAGTSLTDVEIIGTDPDGDNVQVEAFSQIFDAGFPSFASLTPVTGFRPSPATSLFNWTTNCNHVRLRPYEVVFKVTDNPGNGTRLATYKTWAITVVAPKPIWEPAVVNAAERSVALEWQPYMCQQATTMQIWRKVEGTDFQPENCETGMPEYLGYELIQTVPISDANGPVTTFTDTNNDQGLSPGARYCYRLVAVFPGPKGGESLVSDDICIEPFDINVPLVTKVSVERTDPSSGEIRVAWFPPTDLIATPGPHNLTYSVFRGEGFQRTSAVEIATKITGLEIVDQSLDTENKIYNYTIDIYDNDVFMGTSAVASSVRLEAESQFERIRLTWSANVPWSNQIAGYPTHIIYRGPENAADDELVQIATVDVTQQGFEYIDEGPLDDDLVYCYKIETFGGYGNDDVPEPLQNFSQRLCARPGDSIPPCKPLAIMPNNNRCEDYVNDASTCGNNVFSNTIQWSRPTDECGDDISYYNIYSSSSPNGTWNLLQGNVRDTFYIDNVKQSFKRCYRITAVDRTLNESEMSDPICVDNCPYYELPNVFTPNDDGCNDVFSAYREFNLGENGEGCGMVEGVEARCPRFVISVVFHVYNRWGKEVYNYESGGENTIYINWDGRDSNGSELSTGVYYYIAEVNFDAIDPKKKFQTIKGWVHLIRGEQ